MHRKTVVTVYDDQCRLKLDKVGIISAAERLLSGCDSDNGIGAHEAFRCEKALRLSNRDSLWSNRPPIGRLRERTRLLARVLGGLGESQYCESDPRCGSIQLD